MLATRDVFAAAFVLSIACSSENPPDRNVEVLTSDIDVARSEVVRHQAAIAHAATLDEVATEVDQHELNMSAPMNMLGNMDGMLHCSGSGMGTIFGGMSSLESEMQTDRATMVSAATLADARAECTAHTARLNEILDDMAAALGKVNCMMSP